jgi:hypothetical protein
MNYNSKEKLYQLNQTVICLFSSIIMGHIDISSIYMLYKIAYKLTKTIKMFRDKHSEKLYF